jgi:hypothetical protein
MRIKRNAYRVFLAKPERKRPLGISRRRWGLIIKCILEKQDGVIWTGSFWLMIGAREGHP